MPLKTKSDLPPLDFIRTEIQETKIGLERAKSVSQTFLQSPNLEALLRYRRSLRRCINQITEIQYTTEARTCRKLKKQFELLSKPTDSFRDLETLLVAERFYRERLNDLAASNLDILFGKLRAKREKRRLKVSKFFESKTFRNTFAKANLKLEQLATYLHKTNTSDTSLEILKNEREEEIQDLETKVKYVNFSSAPDRLIHEARANISQIKHISKQLVQLESSDRNVRLFALYQNFEDIYKQYDDICSHMTFFKRVARKLKPQIAKELIYRLRKIKLERKLRVARMTIENITQARHSMATA